MSALRSFQRKFGASIISDSFDGPIDGAAQKDAWRFGVYRNNFFHGLVEQLREAYPSVTQILGKDGFAVVARGYLVHYPPTTRSLALFGQQFPAYLASISLTQDDAVLCGLARLDRAYLEALHAEDLPVLDPACLGELGDTLVDARFVKHPATHILPSQIPLIDHWRVKRGGPENAIPQHSETGAQNALAALVTRPNLTVQVTEITDAEAAFGNDLLDGKPVSHAFETALGLNSAFDITKAFRTFLAAGAFAAASS